MSVRRTAIVRNNYKDASYLMFGGAGGSDGSIGGCGGSGANIQLAMQKEKDRKKQEVKEQLKEYKRQLGIKEEIRKQKTKLDVKIKQDQLERKRVWDEINNETKKYNEPKEHFVITFIKNIGKKKPPKNMTIVQ